MDETDVDVRIFIGKVTGKMFCAVDRAMLTARAAEADHETAESASAVGLHMWVHDTIDMFQETEHFSIVFKEFDYLSIPACKFFIRLVTSWIMDAAAVEDVAASVT